MRHINFNLIPKFQDNVSDGIGEGDSQSMDTTTISSSILSSVFSSEQSSLTSQSHDVEIHALASGEMAGVEEIIPEHQTTSTLKRNVFRRASHKIKDGTYNRSLAFDFGGYPGVFTNDQIM